MSSKIVDALNAAQRAIGDWVATYAPEHSGSARADEAIGRLNAHGTLAYLAGVAELIEAALAEARAAQDGEWVTVPRAAVEKLSKAMIQSTRKAAAELAYEAWAAINDAPPAPAAEPVAIPKGWILTPEHPTDTQVLKLMNVGLRHAEYKKGTGGPTVDEMRQGMAYALQAGPEPPAPPPVAKSAEPVAWADPQAFRNFKERGHLGGAYAREWMWAKPDIGLVPLYTAPPPVEASQQQAEGDCTWEHAANEWADVATNAVTVLENVRDGITSFEDAIASFKSWYESARAAQPGTEKQAEPASGETARIDGNETNPIVLWTEIERLRAAVKGPQGYESWQSAATDERMRRVRAEMELSRLTAELSAFKEENADLYTRIVDKNDELSAAEAEAADWKAAAESMHAEASEARAEAEALRKDAERLDFVLEKGAFLFWKTADSGTLTCQLWDQDEDENHYSISGDRWFSNPRDAVDAAIAAQQGGSHAQG